MPGYRKYRVVRKVKESKQVVSLYLQPLDQGALPLFKPGQHLMFKLYVPGRGVPAFRNYSFSDAFHPDYYRISVKRASAPAGISSLPDGLCSSYLYDQVEEGDILEAKGPSGDFYLDPEDSRPVVLVAGGIGVTPLLCMAKSIIRVNPGRPVRFFYGVNDTCEHAFKEELARLKSLHAGFSLTTFYREIGSDDVQGIDFDRRGLINMAAIAEQAGDGFAYYVCGPEPMMDAVISGLSANGVIASDIHTESFLAHTDTVDAQDLSPQHEPDSPADGFMIEFIRSAKRLPWDNRYVSILEFAEANEVEISSGCLFGDCGTCLTRIRGGQIKYTHPTLVKPGEDHCLPCSCVPVSNLVLEA